MALVGWKADIKISGTATTMTNEAMTDLGSNVWQVTNTAKRLISPTATITVSEGTVQSVDRLYGKVTFTGTVTAPTITSTYLPTTSAAEARQWALNMSGRSLDATGFISGAASTAFRSKELGPRDVRVTLGRFTQDPSSDTIFRDALENDTTLGIELWTDHDDTEPHARIWGLSSAVSSQVNWDNLAMDQITLAGKLDNDGTAISFGG